MESIHKNYELFCGYLFSCGSIGDFDFYEQRNECSRCGCLFSGRKIKNTIPADPDITGCYICFNRISTRRCSRLGNAFMCCGNRYIGKKAGIYSEKDIGSQNSKYKKKEEL